MGVKVTENVQLPAAGTLLPQVSVLAKSPLMVIDEMVSGELPMFRRRTVCGWLVEPINWGEYWRAAGLTDTDGAEFGPIFSTNASVFPPSLSWKAGWIVGKSIEFVAPAT